MSGIPRSEQHGYSNTPTHQTWTNMLARCHRKNHPYFDRYGGRGISVCDRWGKFKNFLTDMGEQPSGKELDRINNDGNYEKSNCRWISRREQCWNMSSNRMLTYKGETRCASEWASVLGMKVSTIFYRLSVGWPVEKALSTPPMKRK